MTCAFPDCRRWLPPCQERPGVYDDAGCRRFPNALILPEITESLPEPRTSIYHEEHPLHWLVLDELEEWEEAYGDRK